MKKTILLSAVLAAGASFAGSVTSGNAVGALNVGLANAEATLIAVPFLGYGTADAVAVEDMVKTSDLAAGSKLYVADGKGNYNVWSLDAEGKWVSANNVLIDNKGASTEKSAAPANKVTANRGDSFWLEPIFKTDKASGTVFLLGQGTTTAGESTVAKGWNLIGNTSTTAKNVPNGDEGEKVCVPNEAGGLDTYTWRTDASTSGWMKGRTIKTISIAPGKGFWFLAKTEKKIQWN